MKLKIFFCLLLISNICYTQDEILNYEAEISVLQDRSVKVTEVIEVFAGGMGGAIQRGIYREIATLVVDKNGEPIPTEFNLIEVLKDGKRENYSLSEQNNFVSIRIGDEDVFLEKKPYTYTISYTLSEQIRMFEGYDEIYWNVIGTYWEFYIKKGSATIHLPEGAGIIQESAYTGAEGEKNKNYSFKLIDDQTVYYELTEPLYPFSGLTIAIGFTRGFVNPPSEQEMERRALIRWIPRVIMLLGLCLVIAYYIYAWKRVGVDPKKKSIIPRFEPLDGLSPSAVRFISRMGFDNKNFSTAIISMAVKKYLTIKKLGNHYELEISPEKQHNLSIEEQKVANELFSKGNSLVIEQKNHGIIGKAKTDLGKQLSLDYEKQYFKHNYKWLVPGFLLSILTIISTILFIQNDQLMGRVVGCVFLSIFFGIFATLSFYNISNAGTAGKILRLIIGSALTFLILFIPIYLFNDTDHIIEINFIFYYLPIILLCFFNGLFTYLMKAPTVIGREIMDEIEGLKMYIKTAEKDRLNMLNPPEKTPELFEKLLPYAIALNVEHKWSSQFSKILEKAMEDGSYNAVWYHGNNMHSISLITSDLGSSFSSSLSTASVSPSSGSGGGGSSGGGGGGGGGGGW